MQAVDRRLGRRGYQQQQHESQDGSFHLPMRSVCQIITHSLSEHVRSFLQTEAPLKHIKTLHTKKGRKEQAAFLAEGVRVLEEAMRLKHLPVEVVVADAMLSERGRQLVNQFRKRDIPITEVAAKQLVKLSETRTPQGIIALFKTPALRLSELSTRNLRTVLLCEGISDPGNLGTLFRSALAFGFDRVILLASSVEPYAPKVVRSSAGAVFGLQVAVDW